MKQKERHSGATQSTKKTRYSTIKHVKARYFEGGRVRFFERGPTPNAVKVSNVPKYPPVEVAG
jgi:hypothetical protein